MKSISNVKVSSPVDRAIFGAVVFILIFAITIKLETSEVRPAPALDLKSSSNAVAQLCSAAFGQGTEAYANCLKTAEGKIEAKEGKPISTGVKTGVQIWAGKSLLKAQYLQILFEQLDKSSIPYTLKIYFNEEDKLYRYVVSPKELSQYQALLVYLSENKEIRAVFIVPKAEEPVATQPPAPAEAPQRTPIDYGELVSSEIKVDGKFFSRTVTVENKYKNGYGESFSTPQTTTIPLKGYKIGYLITATSSGRILGSWDIRLEPKKVETGKIDVDLANILESYGGTLCDARRILEYRSPAGFTYAQFYKKIKVEGYKEWKLLPDPDNLERSLSTYEGWSGYLRDSWVCEDTPKDLKVIDCSTSPDGKKTCRWSDGSTSTVIDSGSVAK